MFIPDKKPLPKTLRLLYSHCNAHSLSPRLLFFVQTNSLPLGTQHTATHCAATHCNTRLQHAAIHCNTLQHTAQHVTTHANTLQRTALPRFARHYSTVSCITLRCNTLQQTATHVVTHGNTLYCRSLHDTIPRYLAMHCAATRCNIRQQTALPLVARHYSTVSCCACRLRCA